MKTLLTILVLSLAACASTPSNVVCSGGSKDMECHVRTADVVITGRPNVSTGK